MLHTTIKALSPRSLVESLFPTVHSRLDIAFETLDLVGQCATELLLLMEVQQKGKGGAAYIYLTVWVILIVT